MKKEPCLLVLSTIDSPVKAEKIASALVREKLAACVNLSAPIRSVYEWKGKLHRDKEILMLIKTRKGLYQRLEKRLKTLHPYELPEIVALPFTAGSAAYFNWVFSNTL